MYSVIRQMAFLPLVRAAEDIRGFLWYPTSQIPLFCLPVQIGEFQSVFNSTGIPGVARSGQ